MYKEDKYFSVKRISYERLWISNEKNCNLVLMFISEFTFYIQASYKIKHTLFTLCIILFLKGGQALFLCERNSFHEIQLISSKLSLYTCFNGHFKFNFLRVIQFSNTTYTIYIVYNCIRTRRTNYILVVRIKNVHISTFVRCTWLNFWWR